MSPLDAVGHDVVSALCASRLTTDTQTDSLTTEVATLTAAYEEDSRIQPHDRSVKPLHNPRARKRTSTTKERPGATKSASGPKPRSTLSAAEVRALAERRGIVVAKQRRIPVQVMEQYLAARSSRGCEAWLSSDEGPPPECGGGGR
jgi:hypothetical protein